MRGQPSIPGMSDGTGTPYLGAHVVGQRVVVRRLVPGSTGPTGGTAFTDVLGDCIAWDPCVVVTATGERVEIPLELIVSGKPVPPRPSVHMRASVAECEARVAGLWPDVVAKDLAGWTLRHSPTVERRRANSCLALAEPSVPLERALARVREHYDRTGREPLLAVERDSAVAQACRRSSSASETAMPHAVQLPATISPRNAHTIPPITRITARIHPISSSSDIP